MAEEAAEWHDPRCALLFATASPATGKYVPKESQTPKTCICKEIRARNSMTNSPPPLRSSLKQSRRRSREKLEDENGEEVNNDIEITSPLRRRRPRFDARPPNQEWPSDSVRRGEVLDIVESLIRLSILSALLFSAETQPEVSISKMTPPLNLTRILGEAEADLMEEGTRQSHHDFVTSVKDYVRTLSHNAIFDRMMNASTLTSLPRSLQYQITRYTSALQKYDMISLRQNRDERHRLIMDRRRLQDEYRALRRMEECVIALQLEQGLHSSIIVTLNAQLDLLISPFSGLNCLLKHQAIIDLLDDRTDPLITPQCHPDVRSPLPPPKPPLHQRFLCMNKELYRSSPSLLNFILHHRLTHSLFVAIILRFSWHRDTWFCHMILQNYQTEQVRTLVAAELPHLLAFLFWVSFELFFLALQTAPLMHTLFGRPNSLPGERDSSFKGGPFYGLAILGAFFTLLFLVVGCFFYAGSSVWGGGRYIVGNTLGVASLFRVGNGFCVAAGLGWEEVVCAWEFEVSEVRDGGDRDGAEMGRRWGCWGVGRMRFEESR